ncbi:MAG TPA: twin-arginine translocation signal domain-containing protein, partial [Bryobacteraceae bacterium]|nr:twin-arginine translocation signal domain-containing protein [Bryobacteraceae bacterium]
MQGVLMGREVSNRSRRDFISAAAGAGGAMLLGPGRLGSAEVDPRAAQIVGRTIAVDMHSHVQIRFINDPPGAAPDADLDLASEMKRAGFSAICQTYSVDNLRTEQVGEHHEYHLQALAFEDRLLTRNRLRRALNMQDLRIAHGQGQPIVIQSAEG